MATTILRHPAVAGRFYPGDPDDLRAEALGYLSQSISSESGSGASHRVHRSACGIHVFRACGGSGVCPGGSSTALHRAVSQPHRDGPPARHDERRRMADAAGRRSHRRRTRCGFEATLPCPAGRPGGASRRACRRSRTSIPAAAPAGAHVSFPSRWARGNSKLLEHLGKALADVICRAERSCADRRFQRHESLRVGRGDAREGSSGDRAHSHRSIRADSSTWSRNRTSACAASARPWPCSRPLGSWAQSRPNW